MKGLFTFADVGGLNFGMTRGGVPCPHFRFKFGENWKLFLNLLDDPGNSSVAQPHQPFLARLALEMEMQCRTGDVDMPVSEGRQPETLVFAGISGVADPDETVVQQPDHGRDNTLKVKAAATQIGLHLFTQAGQRVGKRAKRIELGGAAMLSPVGVVSVLLATSFVAPGCLDVTAGVLAYPHIGPGRWNGECADALQFGCIRPPALVINIGKPGAPLAAVPAGVVVA